jgi:hypothetical protein
MQGCSSKGGGGGGGEGGRAVRSSILGQVSSSKVGQGQQQHKGINQRQHIRGSQQQLALKTHMWAANVHWLFAPGIDPISPVPLTSFRPAPHLLPASFPAIEYLSPLTTSSCPLLYFQVHLSRVSSPISLGFRV